MEVCGQLGFHKWPFSLNKTDEIKRKQPTVGAASSRLGVCPHKIYYYALNRNNKFGFITFFILKGKPSRCVSRSVSCRECDGNGMMRASILARRNLYVRIRTLSNAIETFVA